MNANGPLIVQSDKTLLLEVDHPDATACRMAIAPFAELERSPEHMHTYRLTPLGLWNARAAGHDAERWSTRCCASPATRCRTRCSSTWPRRWTATAGSSWPTTPRTGWCCAGLDRAVLVEVAKSKKLAGMLGAQHRPGHHRGAPVRARPAQAGAAEAGLAGRGPRRLRRRRGARDRAARRTAGTLRAYQREAVEHFWAGGSGVVVLPCGAGKTLVGAAAMAEAGATTLILVTNTVAGPAVEARAARPHLAHRGRDRRVLGRAQGDPPGHDRDVPGADDPTRRDVPAPRTSSTPATGG